MDEIFQGMEIASEQYLEFGDDGNVTRESWEFAFQKIGGICRVREEEREKPYLKDLYYIRGILRKRFHFNEQYFLGFLEAAVLAGATTSWLSEHAKACGDYLEFHEVVNDFIDAQG